ncbi:hypothetical protein J524_1630 [Acinetobacter baumannii 496487]|nr:hypothetical protein J618_3203 [Acinetobacter baumannii 607805]EXQ89850.1 putative transposase [Acinetobacter baumannii 1170863]EXR09866.1 putative transposase [Acinetobacter baumannii 1413735]EXR68916.1 putative transposase [Acinetobacter baumannii 14216]EXR82079.1 putative transposase [Acinetobacter baumannii 214216]EYT26551.1 putative transposase domain protein [Acinetobacter baumannii 1195185_11]KCX58123.1 hypothetical protein J524_1630 [Acinetobacter baumannii 496487]KCY26234.1 putat
MGSCAAPSAKGDDKFITTDYLQQCHYNYHKDPKPAVVMYHCVSLLSKLQ